MHRVPIRSVRVRDVVADNAHRTSEIFGLAFPGLPLPSVVQGTDARRMKPVVDPHYASEEDTQQMKSPHMETRHLLSLLLAIVRSPGQREESRARKFRAALLVKDFLNSAARARNVAGVAAVLVGGCALPLQYGRLALANSPFQNCHGWVALTEWWQHVLDGSEILPSDAKDLLENHAV